MTRLNLDIRERDCKNVKWIDQSQDSVGGVDAEPHDPIARESG
jgi:hypothetical protein